MASECAGIHMPRDINPDHTMDVLPWKGGERMESTSTVLAGTTPDIDEEVLKDDGQKADDAEVKVEMWDASFQTDRAADNRITHPLRIGWRQGLTKFRNAHLRLWRKRQLRCWIEFGAASGHKGHWSARELTHESWFNLTQTRSYPIRRGPGNQPQSQPFDWKYTWTAGERSGGRSLYRRWHKKRHQQPAARKPTFDIGRDGMSQIADCSWWE